GVTRMSRETGYGASRGTIAIPSNIYNPSPIPPDAAVRNSMARSAETTLDSIAIADTLSFAQDTVLLTIGARKQTVETDSYDVDTGARMGSYKADAISPVAGIVIKPLDNVSVYGNFTEGLTPGQVVGGEYDNAGEVLTPYKSK